AQLVDRARIGDVHPVARAPNETLERRHGLRVRRIEQHAQSRLIERAEAKLLVERGNAELHVDAAEELRQESLARDRRAEKERWIEPYRDRGPRAAIAVAARLVLDDDALAIAALSVESVFPFRRRIDHWTERAFELP